ncbi:hypothetical protein BLNAU_17993 [Blattamonas nauphoetae]|uniref:Protein kinase domain-containing protein n=1 Tax=Blattamonas nauphoetae TaxID=2049346 RepID=A0ABQ9X5V7_9EUKA|nr:hypothetical protein BLNAU_17993 [Blattamonas nauphoetae]
MTASGFTDAEKTTIELSFETRALKGSTSYSMMLQSIGGEGETVHEKKIVVTTNTDGVFPPFTVILYPIEEDETKRKGQLEFGTEYEVKCILEDSKAIHFESTETIFSTPAEPIRIEKTKCTLGGEKEKSGVVEFWGVGLSGGSGYTLKVKKEESEGVVSGEEIELTGTLSWPSESGSFSHSEEIFGKSSPRVSFGETYLVVGIAVGGVEGVVNKNVRFSVPGEPSRLTKMTASGFTDAEKTTIELSFETRALKGNTSYSMMLQSIGGEGETVHEKKIVVTTNTDGVFPPFTVILYPIEEDETKRKGQLEFGTEYEVKCILEDSKAIHFESTETIFSTPAEPIRIEKTKCTLGGEKEKSGVVEFWGVGLSGGSGYTLKVKKEESEGVVSGEEIELTGTLSWPSESGSFSHSEEIFGKSSPRVSFGETYLVVGIAVGGVEGVVNKNVRFSVPGEPSRLTKMTASGFTDAEKTTIELSFETRALKGSTSYSMMLQSIGGEGETVHEKKIVVTTNTDGVFPPFTVILYPIEEDETKRKGQLEFGTEYEVKCILEDSKAIHFESTETIFSTPAEPIRIEKTKCTLGGEKEKSGVVEFWGVGLSGGSGYTLKVKKEESEGVVSGEEIELTGTLSWPSESGSFSHSEEIFGKSSPRVSFGETYLVVGIAVGGVEGVVNKNVRFSVPGEPSRLTKMTASGFTDAEKTTIELSFETRALKGSTSYSMMLQSIGGEGETVHEKKIVVTTNTDGVFPPFTVILYPIEEDETKRKGQLEFGTEYEVKCILEDSKAIHFESTETIFSTPAEPIRIEKTKCTLGGEKEKSGVVEFWGVGLSGGSGYTLKVKKEESEGVVKDRLTITLFLSGWLLTTFPLSICLDNGSNTWIPPSPIAVQNNTHCSVVFQVGKIEDSDSLAYGHHYTLQQEGESANFAVNSGIVIYIPNPPILSGIKFSFANTLNTSCVVEVIGIDLVASTEYNVTLNSSLCVIIHFWSSTSGKSRDIEIGWAGGLEFETEYIVTSIKPLCEDDGEILVLGSVSGETGKRPTSFNIFADSSSLEGSPFCGDISRACSSISEVWKIVCGLWIVRPTIEIVDSVKMENGIVIVGGMHVVIRNGSSSEPSLIVPSSSSLDSLSAMIVVEATGFLELRNVDVSIESSDPSFVFISATLATIILRDGSVIGPTTPSFSRNEEEDEEICSWTSGVLQLTDCSTNISDNKMALLAQGVLAMNGGSLIIEASLFHDNTPPIESFPSFRRNLICSDNGSIAVRSLSGGDGFSTERPHLWMATDGCTMTGEYAKPLSPLFIPSLSNTSTSSFDKKKELFEIEVKGSTLIPCGLFVEVFEVTKDKKEGTPSRHSLNRNTTTSFSESSIKLALPSSSLSSLKPELEWRGRLIFGEDQKTDVTFLIQLNKIEKLSQSVKENMKWWLPLVIVVAVALLVLVLLIVVCVWRRRRNGKKEDSVPLITAQEMEVEKFDVMDEDFDRQTAHVSSVRVLNGNTVNVGHWTENERSDLGKKEEKMEEREIPFENRVYGLSCGEKEGVVEVVDKTETLYRRLHVSKVGVDRRWAQLSVARGLSHAMKMWEYSAILTELTSHSVVLSGEKQMNLILKSDSTVPDPLTEQPTHQNEEINPNQHEDAETTDTPLNSDLGNPIPKPTHSHPGQILRPHPLRQSEVHRDDVRWQAPEEGEDGVQTNEGEVKKEIDRSKVSVFRLGLVLWEIETGHVPFSEQDGVNAHRNLMIGILPKMEGVGEKMKSLIEECLSVNPDERPSLDSIISRLSSMDGKESAQKDQHIALS